MQGDIYYSISKGKIKMFEIVEKTYLNPSMTKMVIKAPLVAAKAQA